MLTRLTGSSLTHVSLRTIFFCKIKHEVDEVSVGVAMLSLRKEESNHG